MRYAGRAIAIPLSLAVCVIAVVLAVGGTAYAVPSYLTSFEAAYPDAVGSKLDACLLCHVNPNPGPSARNPFGSDYASGGHNFNAALEALDSDGDGILNGAEIAALTFPGDPNDPPAAGSPNIAVSPVSVAFGEVVENDNTAPSVVTISNMGDAVLNVSSIALDAGTDFTLDLSGGPNPCAAANPAIAALDNCTVAVVFAPSSVGALSDNLAIASDDPDQSNVNVALTGTGLDNVTPAVASATGSGTITLDTFANPGSSFVSVSALSDTDPSVNQAGKPSGFTFPDGLVTFQLAVANPGDNASVTIMFPSGVPAGSAYYKVDAAGFSEFAGATINADNVVLLLTDGGSGDNDNTVDGVITDPGGLATPVPSSSGGGGGGSCSVIGSGGDGGSGAVLFLTLLAILVTLRLKVARARR